MTEQTMKLEACFERLEQILSALERNDVPLDTAVSLYEEGMTLVGQCSRSLSVLKNRVMILRERNGALTEEPMDAGDEDRDDLEPVR